VGIFGKDRVEGGEEPGILNEGVRCRRELARRTNGKLWGWWIRRQESEETVAQRALVWEYILLELLNGTGGFFFRVAPIELTMCRFPSSVDRHRILGVRERRTNARYAVRACITKCSLNECVKKLSTISADRGDKGSWLYTATPIERLRETLAFH
jgi:hypothetical protein